MQKISCELIRDLIPLVKDRVASSDSRKLVEEHIGACDECRDYYFSYEKFVEIGVESELRILKSLKRKSIFLISIFILIGSLIGVMLASTEAVFYNFLIMPFLGGLSHYIFGNKSLFLPILVFIISYTREILISLRYISFKEIILSDYLTLPGIYFIFVCLGILISILLQFALNKEEKDES